ncbi:hypothetical protein, partial [Streptomyces sp. UNOC14_S4]|uniref:hypothetical protein n=1 Tax=Streptomyces sp. UNOC14_S4 TaxID=2872340 RepID=UPI001E485462
MNALAGDAPWWAGVLLSLSATVAVIVRSVFPQDSADRLVWWRERRLHRERLASSHAPRSRRRAGRRDGR